MPTFVIPWNPGNPGGNLVARRLDLFLLFSQKKINLSMDCADHDKSFIVGSTWSSAKKLKSSLIKECSRASANSENDSLRDKGRGKKYKGWSCCGKIDEERCTFSVSATQNGNIWTITKSNLIHTAHEVVNNPKKSRSIALQCLNSSFLRNYVCTDKIGGKESKAAKALVAQANSDGTYISLNQANKFIRDSREDFLEHELLSFTNIVFVYITFV